MRRWIVLAVGVWALPVGAQLFWRVSPPGGGGPSYLFGTAHLKDRRVFELPESLPDLMASCRVFAPEMDLDEPAKARLAERLLLPGQMTLEDFYDPEDYALLAERFRALTGMGVEPFRRFRPVGLLLYYIQSLYGTDEEESLDEFLRSMAMAKGLRVVGLETVEEQIELLESVSPGQVLEYFLDADPVDQAGEAERVLRLYLDEDVEGMVGIDTGPWERAVMLDLRNRRLTERLKVLMAEGPVFCAVGAAHLGGTNGMIGLLRRQGYLVEPLPKGSGVPMGAEERWDEDEWPFTVAWPGRPVASRSMVGTPLGRFEVRTWTGRSRDLTVAVSVSDYPEAVVAMVGEDAVYRTGLDMAAEQVGGRVVSQGRAEVAGRRGRRARILFDAGRQELLVRVLAHQGRLYVLQAVLPAGADPAEAERFFASFAVP